MNKQVDYIAEAMRAGQPPWRAGMVPVNAWSNANYNGINAMLLNAHALRHGFKSPYWATYQQWGHLRLKVKKRPETVTEGQWAANIVVARHPTAPQTANVFNAEQVFGLTAAQWQKPAPVQNVEEFDPSGFASAWGGCQLDKLRLILEIANGLKGQPIDPKYDEYLPIWLKAMSDDPSFFTKALVQAYGLVGKPQ